MRRLAVVLTLLLAAATSRADPGEPTLELGHEGRLLVTDLPAIFDDKEVAEHLTSGLTTTLVLTVKTSLSGATKLEGGARITIRFELWDEVFNVTAFGGMGPLQSSVLESKEQLTAWWRSLRLPVMAVPDGEGIRGRAEITLDVLPFSRSEELDTERWFSESVLRAEEGRRSGISHPTEGKESLAEVLDILIATSIRRRSLTSYSWTIPWPEGSTP